MKTIFMNNSSYLVSVYILCGFVFDCSNDAAKSSKGFDSTVESFPNNSDAVFDTNIEFPSENSSDTSIDITSDSIADISTDSYNEAILDVPSKPTPCEHPQVVENCENGWCRIEPGCYLYGSYPNEPYRSRYAEEQVWVTLTRPFVIAQTEVTQEQWESVGLLNPSIGTICGDCPVNNINWFETLAYCNALSERDGYEKCYGLSCCEGTVGDSCRDEGTCGEGFSCDCQVNRFANVYECPGYRLPTSGEWEYAARAGTVTETYVGNVVVRGAAPDGSCPGFDPVVDRIAWYCHNTDGTAMPVGLKEKNPLGLFDMLGNVYEWASDPSRNTPYGRGEEHIIDPYGFVDGDSTSRTLRGGGFFMYPGGIRSGAYFRGYLYSYTPYHGFRPVRTLFK